MTSIRHLARRMPAIAIGLFSAAIALSALSCANPLGRSSQSGKGSLAIKVRLPAFPRGSSIASNLSSRFLTRQTVSMSAQLLQSGEIVQETSAEPDSEGTFTLAFTEVPVGSYRLDVSASDNSGVYALSRTEIQVNAGNNQQAIVLFPEDPHELDPGNNGGLSIEAGRTGIYSFTAPYSGTWTINLSGASTDILVFGNDGRTLASYSGGSRISLPAMAAGDRAYIAVYAGDEARTMTAAAARSPTASVNPAFGTAGFGSALGIISNSADVIEDMVELPDGRIVAVGTSTPIDPEKTGQAFVALFTAQMELDASFAECGRVFLGISTAGSEALSCALQKTGESVTGIIVAGRYFDGTRYYCYFVTRISLIGKIDTSAFGTNGFFTRDNNLEEISDSSCIAPDCAVDSDGRILVSMNSASANPHFMAVRLSRDGVLDTSFGPSSNGTVISNRANMCADSIVFSTETRQIYIAGHDRDSPTWYISKLSENGTALAASFGENNWFFNGATSDTRQAAFPGSGATVSDATVSFTNGPGTRTEALFISGTNERDTLTYPAIGVIRAGDGDACFSDGMFGGSPASAIILNGYEGASIAVDENGASFLCVNSIIATPGDPQHTAAFKITTDSQYPEYEGGTFNPSTGPRLFSIYQFLANTYEAAGKVLVRSDGSILFGGRTVSGKVDSTQCDLLLFECDAGNASVNRSSHHPLRRQDMNFYANLCLDDGSTIAVGQMEYQALIAKFTPGGQLDTRFSGDGYVTYEGSHDTPSAFYAVARASKDDVAAAGKLSRSISDISAFAVSLNAQTGNPGSLWSSKDWAADTDYNQYELRSLCFASDGTAIIGANRLDSGPTYYRQILGVDSSGVRRAIASLSSDDDHPDGIFAVIDDTDQILAAQESNDRVYIARTRWNGFGFAETVFPGNEAVSIEGTLHSPKLYLDQDGSYYMLAREYFASSYIPVAQKYDPAHALRWSHASSAFTSEGASLAGAIHPDGRFFIVGSSPSNPTSAFISAFTADGQDDLGFGPLGTMAYLQPGADMAFTDLRINAVGDIIASGYRVLHGNKEGLTVSFR